MKTIIKRGFSVRRRLIRDKKSHLPGAWAEQQMKKVEYWLATYPPERVVKNNYKLIVILLPKNFLFKFNAKFDENYKHTL
jgi:hypothetical protein